MMIKQKTRHRRKFRLMYIPFVFGNLGSYLFTCAHIAFVTYTQIDAILGGKFSSHLER